MRHDTAKHRSHIAMRIHSAHYTCAVCYSSGAVSSYSNHGTWGLISQAPRPSSPAVFIQTICTHTHTHTRKAKYQQIKMQRRGDQNGLRLVCHRYSDGKRKWLGNWCATTTRCKGRCSRYKLTHYIKLYYSTGGKCSGSGGPRQTQLKIHWW